MPMKSFGSVKVFYPEYSRDELIERLREGVRQLAALLPLERVVLFGSWSRGRATAFSDIDLLVIYAGPPRDDAYRLVRSAIELRGLEPHIYTSDEAVLLEATLNRMTIDGVILYPEPS
jgi:predicted nucleotidyltransferase